MKVYEVFLRKGGKEPFEHAGSLEAPDDELALLLAREAYVRRGEGREMWLVDRADVLVAEPDLLAVNDDRPHRRHPGGTLDAAYRHRREPAPA